MHSVPSVQSGAQHTFSISPQADIPRASFNRSHGYKTTFDEGQLVPIFVDEVLPGDTFNLSMTGFARMATPIYPIMDNLYMETFFFFVPCRLVWENWERFNGAQDDPTDSTDYTIPVLPVPSDGVDTSDLADYFGIPIGVSGLSLNALPFRSYNLIYNEWFRDENLQNSLVVETDDGPDTYSNYNVVFRGKRHDYFTSCLPWPQKINDGNVVEIPLGSQAPIYSNGGVPNFMFGATSSSNPLRIIGNPLPNQSVEFTGIATVTSNMYFTPGQVNGLYADLADATSATINQLRYAFQLQKLYERDARGGTRYTEIIRSHFNVVSPDMRLQRPEYLGGGSQMISINPVAQTAPPTSEDDTPQGNLAAFGLCHFHGHGFTKSFTEHGYIIGLIATRADLNYQQGVHRLWSRSGRWDFYWPALSHIGEQAVFNKEIYAQGTSADTSVFGYQEAWAEYRYKPGLITGSFRSTASPTLDAWHLAQQFTSLPTLNSTFIQENAPMSRIEAVTSQPDFIFDAFFNLTCVRPMPVYSVPGLIDHF